MVKQPRRTKVKICGITNLEDALAAVLAGADAIGFVFYRPSPRYIEPGKARQISLIIPQEVKKVGVFVDEAEIKIKKTARLCHLDLLQFHGQESPEFCRRFRGYKIIKALRLRKEADLARMKEYKTYGFIFDAFDKNKIGGTGKKFNWKILKQTDKIKHPFFLSGGLSSRNVESALAQTKAPWVDASSSLESRPGKKDHQKIMRFIKKAKLRSNS